jgi:hypothetical protein
LLTGIDPTIQNFVPKIKGFEGGDRTFTTSIRTRKVENDKRF